MSRILKFRAWDKEKSKMILTDEAQYTITGAEFKDTKAGNLQWFFGHCAVHKVDIMQFTGLLDKHGTEIYEGDIVEYKNIEESGIAVVRPIDETPNLCFFWVNQNIKDPSGYSSVYYFGCASELEIIGNIHENPELAEDALFDF